LIQHQIDSLIENKSKDIDEYQSMMMLENAWHIGITTSTIMNCWKHIHILPNFFDNMEVKKAIMRERSSRSNAKERIGRRYYYLTRTIDIGICKE